MIYIKAGLTFWFVITMRKFLMNKSILLFSIPGKVSYIIVTPYMIC